MADSSRRMLLILFLTCCVISTANGSLGQYIPALGEYGNANRDELIDRYFHLGLQHVEIVAFLTLVHGIKKLRNSGTRELRNSGTRELGNSGTRELGNSGTR